MNDPGLNSRDESEAARTQIHVVWYVFTAEDAVGEDVTWGIPLTIHRSAHDADSDSASRSAPPAISHAEPGGRYVRDGPVNLLAFVRTGFASADEARAVLRGAGPVALARPGRWYAPSYYASYLKSPPLSLDECRRAAGISVWTVYYEDRFHFGPSRECYPVAVCLTRAEGESELRRRGRPVESGADGYLLEGPSALARDNDRSPAIGADVVREVLRRIEAQEAGPVKVG